MGVVRATINNKVQVSEDLLLGAELGTNPRVTHNAGAETSLTPSTTPPVTTVWSDRRPLVAGADTIDLTALVSPGLANRTMTGLKVQSIYLKNNGANAMTFTAGASNGYLIFGAAGSLVLGPGDEALLSFQDSRADIDGTHKTIDVAGTLVQTYDVVILAG